MLELWSTDSVRDRVLRILGASFAEQLGTSLSSSHWRTYGAELATSCDGSKPFFRHRCGSLAHLTSPCSPIRGQAALKLLQREAELFVVVLHGTWHVDTLSSHSRKEMLHKWPGFNPRCQESRDGQVNCPPEAQATLSDSNGSLRKRVLGQVTAQRANDKIAQCSIVLTCSCLGH
jgi:hypothetical protein